MQRFKVGHVAKLARLELVAEEIDLYGEELGEIIAYIQILEQVDTSAVAEIHPQLHMGTMLREDEVGESLPVDVILAQAPERTDDYFKAPQILQNMEV